jgi:Flp pilus assembly pilin Flp
MGRSCIYYFRDISGLLNVAIAMTHNDIFGPSGRGLKGLFRMPSSLYDDRDAAGALEYAVLASFMGAVVAVGVRLFGTAISDFLSNVGIAIAAFAT